MSLYLYLHHFNFTKDTKSTVGKLYADIPMTSSEKEGTRTQVLKFQSNFHLPYILPLSSLILYTQLGDTGALLFISNLMLINVLVMFT